MLVKKIPDDNPESTIPQKIWIITTKV